MPAIQIFSHTMCVYMCMFRFVFRTNSLWGEDLGEASREGDEDYWIGDPGQILQQHITIQTTVHPLLCCGHKNPGITCKTQSSVSSKTDQHKTLTKRKSVHHKEQLHLPFQYIQTHADKLSYKLQENACMCAEVCLHRRAS